jgi:hypothetical protein
MNNLSLKKILIVFLTLVFLAHCHSLFDYLAGLEMGGELNTALEPLRQCSPAAKYVLLLLFLTLIAVVLIKKFLINRK